MSQWQQLQASLVFTPRRITVVSVQNGVVRGGGRNSPRATKCAELRTSYVAVFLFFPLTRPSNERLYGLHLQATVHVQ